MEYGEEAGGQGAGGKGEKEDLGFRISSFPDPEKPDKNHEFLIFLPGYLPSAPLPSAPLPPAPH